MESGEERLKKYIEAMENARSKFPDLPDWLPDGWIMKTSRRKDGKRDRTYICPVTGRTFKTRDKVFDYLHCEIASVFARDESVEEKDEPLEKMPEKSPSWLPTGWIAEEKLRGGGQSKYTYKIYIDTLSGTKCYSKPEVLRYLSSVRRKNRKESMETKVSNLKSAGKQLCNSTSNGKRTVAGVEVSACGQSMVQDLKLSGSEAAFASASEAPMQIVRRRASKRLLAMTPK